MAALAAEPYFWLQPTVSAASAVLILVGAGVTVLQRYRADRKEQWWKRTQWALDLIVSGEEDSVVLGLQVLEQQVAARTADTEDAAFIAEVLEPLVDSYAASSDTDEPSGERDADGGPDER